MQTFLLKFFEVYSSLKDNKFIIAGESYGGHYIPALASVLYANRTENKIKLVGIAIGDGLTDPYHQGIAWPWTSLSAGVVDPQVDSVIAQMASTA